MHDRQVVSMPHTEPIYAPFGMYEAVKEGNLVFLSAQAGIDEKLQALPTLAEQAEAAFKHLKVVLQKIGVDEADVVQIMVFIREDKGAEAFANDITTIFSAFKKIMPGCKTASTALGVPMLGINHLFLEVQAIAVKSTL